MAFAADFVGGLAGGLGQGVNMYAQLQRMADAQKQQEMQQQLMQQRAQAQEAETQQHKLNTILNIAKLKPDVREYALQTVGPSLGLDPNDPQIKALLAGAGMDENFVNNLRGAGQQFGLTPEQTGVLEAADPNVAAQQLFGFNRAQQGNQLAQERMGLSEERLKLATQGQQLSQQRLSEQMDRFDQRMSGNIPPIGFQPGRDQLGNITSLTAIPGSPATIPTEGERTSAGFLHTVGQSAERGMKFLETNPDYMESQRANIDRLVSTTNATALAGGLGTAAGGLAGLAMGGIGGHPYAGGAIGSVAGGGIGAAFAETITNAFTSPQGKAFSASWSPFVVGILRGESGKAARPDEWVEAFHRFIPMPGDPPETLALKAANRTDAVTALRAKSGRAAHTVTFESPEAKAIQRELAQKVADGTASPQETSDFRDLMRQLGKLK